MDKWHVVKHTDGWTIQTKEGGAGDCIAQQYGNSGEDKATLIAAAPDLLEACKTLLFDAFEDAHPEAVKQARAAIAKAEGRS